MNYSFFDYKYNIANFSSDLFSTWHIIYIVLAYLSVIILCILLPKKKKHNIDLFLKIIGISVLIAEISKVSFESYYDITTGRGFNFGGILPVYTCSIFIFTSLLAGFTKGKIKDICISFLTTVGLISGAIGVVYCNGLNFYPFWTFGAFYSLFFHYSMMLTGIILLASKYKKLEWKDALYAWIPIVIMAVFAIPLNIIYNADYMLLHDASGVPLYHDLALSLIDKGFGWIFTIIMLVTYIPLGGLIIVLYKLILLIFRKKVSNE